MSSSEFVFGVGGVADQIQKAIDDAFAAGLAEGLRRVEAG